MSETPDPSQFIVNERDGEYEATFYLEGECRVTLKASSLDDAKAQAEAMLDGKELCLEPEEVDEATIRSVRKTPKMFLVTRDGSPMQVSHLKAGDTPREAGGNGF